MKKYLLILLVCMMVFTTSGCFKKDDLEGATIYTTVYPITYLVETLYGKNSTINSIYPNGSKTDNYKLTTKQINEYSKADIFVYNGLSNEKEIAKTFLNKNKNLKILDVSYGLKYKNGIEELWMSPSNYLMLATNVKNSLTEFIKNKYLIDEINKNYNSLEEELSIMDAELRTLGETAKSKKQSTLVVSSNMLKFLENYGFDIISLEKETDLTSSSVASIKSDFKNKNKKYIFMKAGEEKTELINDLVDSYDANIIEINCMNTLSDKNVDNNDNYVSLMNEFLDNIRNVVLG